MWCYYIVLYPILRDMFKTCISNFRADFMNGSNRKLSHVDQNYTNKQTVRELKYLNEVGLLETNAYLKLLIFSIIFTSFLNFFSYFI